MMSTLSNQLLMVTILAYLAAMVCHAAEYAFGGRSHIGRAALRPATSRAEARELALVGGSSAPDPAAHAVLGTGVTDQAEPAPWTVGEAQPGLEPPSDLESVSGRGPGSGREPADRIGTWAGRAAVVATLLAALAHVGCLAARGLAAHRMPWGNMYEFVLSVTFVGALAWLVVLGRRPGIRHLGLFVTLVLVVLLGIAGAVLFQPISPLMPALESSWFVTHVFAMILASGIFLLGSVPAAMFLIRAGWESGRRRFPYSLGVRVPSADALDRLTFRLHAFAFPIWTFGVAAGALWAESAWSRYWGWDPKEVWAFISWVVYAGYLHARATPSVRRSTATWIAVFGWLTMLMNLFGVNMFFTGLHSYSGLD